MNFVLCPESLYDAAGTMWGESRSRLHSRCLCTVLEMQRFEELAILRERVRVRLRSVVNVEERLVELRCAEEVCGLAESLPPSDYRHPLMHSPDKCACCLHQVHPVPEHCVRARGGR